MGRDGVKAQTSRHLMKIALKRIYEPAAPQDGFRVLVDRLWPRGIAKEKARIDLWLREIAPSNELRKWFNHDPAKWQPFCARYRAELREHGDPVAALKEKARRGAVTLLYSAQDDKFNQAVALRQFLTGNAAKPNFRSRKTS